MSIKQETLRETGLSVDLVEVQYFEILFFFRFEAPQPLNPTPRISNNVARPRFNPIRQTQSRKVSPRQIDPIDKLSPAAQAKVRSIRKKIRNGLRAKGVTRTPFEFYTLPV